MVESLYTVNEVKDILRLSRSRVHQVLAEGSLRSLKIGRLRRIPASALQEYIDKALAATTGTAQD